MKRVFAFMISLLSVAAVYADKDIKFFMNSGEVKCVAQERIDSISFNEEADEVIVALNGRSELLQLSAIDSIKYGTLPSAVNICYQGEKAVVENPFAFDSVAVEITGAKVTVVSATSKEIDYTLQGSSDDGCFKLYGEK